MILSKEVFSLIYNTIGCAQAEKGGMIGGRNGVVTSFFFDADAITTDSLYIPNFRNLNSILLLWEKKNIEFMGIVHSHGRRDRLLSEKDILYARNILQTNCRNLKEIFFPLVLPAVDNSIIEIIPYRITQDSICVENTKIINTF